MQENDNQGDDSEQLGRIVVWHNLYGMSVPKTDQPLVGVGYRRLIQGDQKPDIPQVASQLGTVEASALHIVERRRENNLLLIAKSPTLLSSSQVGAHENSLRLIRATFASPATTTNDLKENRDTREQL